MGLFQRIMGKDALTVNLWSLDKFEFLSGKDNYMKDNLRLVILSVIALISCSLISGCYATYDPIPPTVEFYEINSKDIPQGTFNLITERCEWEKEE